MALSPSQASAILAVSQDENGGYQIDAEMQEFLVNIEDAASFPAPLVLPEVNPRLAIQRREETGKCVIADSRIELGKTIVSNTGSRISKPIRYSWQVQENVHRVGPGLIDHSCTNPGCGIDPKTDALVSIRVIEPGEIVTFNYLTAELSLISPFLCKCGEAGCFGIIKGFKYLSSSQKKQLKDKFPIAEYLLRYMNL